jgi:Cu(I)/Ag(I) efflux system membrane fusion protein
MSAWDRHKYKLLPLVLAVTVLVTGVVSRHRLRAWFSPSATTAAGSGHVHGAAPPPSAAADTPRKPPRSTLPALPEQTFSEPVLASFRTALDAYEEIRTALAADTLDGVPASSTRLAAALGAVRSGLDTAPEPVRGRVDLAVERSRELETAKDLEGARAAFGKLSEPVVTLMAADARLIKERNVFECPMVSGFNKWLQKGERLENPYMGKKMLACGSESTWVAPAEEPAAEAHVHGDPGAIAFYTCPMHPSVKQPVKGKCPICGMDLVAVTQEELKSGTVRVDAARRQLIGVKTALVEKRDVARKISTVGRITYDETRISEVTIKFKGYIGKLYANATGKKVRRGQTLFTVYSPEIYAAQQELLLALSTRGGVDGGTLGRPDTLVDAARLRLRLWDVPKATIDKLEKDGQPIKYVPIGSPASGFVVEKNVFEGSAVEPGMRLLRIANLDKVWIEAELYEAEIPLVPVGHAATVTLPYLPGRSFDGKVTFVYPYLDPKTRTGKVRVELANKDVELKPDMYANVDLTVSRGERLVVPDSAVIYAGPRRIVFVDVGKDRLKPRVIKVGLRSGDSYEVLEGLQAGERVVTSGNFLIAADSRLKSAAEMW